MALNGPPTKLIEWARLITPCLILGIGAMGAMTHARMSRMEKTIDNIELKVNGHIKYHLERRPCMTRTP